jgi:phosphatidylserine/phosphatidylglycerophosphate/cardiolipin synthase-like enzyme
MQTIIGKNYPKLVIPLIEGAKRSIKIVVYDWRWYENDPANACQLFNASIVRARKRGVNVQVCVNSEAIAQPLRINDIDVKIPISQNLIHTKFLIIDDSILVMGSHNFSQSAFTTNFETSLIVDDALQVNDFVLFFHSIWSL